MFKANRNKEDVKDYEGSSNDYLTKSGIYEDVILKRLIYDEAPNGGAVVNLYVENNKVGQVVYGDIRVFNKGGAKNKIGTDKLNEILVVLGLDGLDEPVEEDLPIGKKGAMKTVTVFEEVEDEPITIKIMNKYSTWNNNIMEKNTVAKVYRNDDKATAAEILLAEDEPDEVELGSKYEKDLEYADSTKYEDNLTEAEVTAWIRAKRPKGTAGGSMTATKKPSFKKPTKKFGK